jgi:Flp pilus assembly pilin Flp
MMDLESESTAMATLLNKLWNDDAGQGIAESTLIIALVAIGLLAILTAFRTPMGRIFQTASDTLNNAQATAYPIS